jgi:hypothetical protein
LPIPSISIITISYNHENYIASCVESVLAQTFPDWEQIILDDGSTDGTGEVVKRFRDSRIRYIRQENAGIEALAHTYNHALRLCRAPVVAILEGDDVWPSRKLSEQLPAFADNQVVLAFGEVRDIDVEGVAAKLNSRSAKKRKKMRSQVLHNDPVRSATPFLLTLDGQSFIAPATVLLRKTALERIGGFQYVPGICPPDVPTFIQLSLLGKFSYTPKVVGYRRRHLTSSTLQYLQPMSAKPREFVFEFMKTPGLGLSETACRAIQRTWRSRSQTREFVTGRICLIQQQWKQARSHFLRALSLGSPRVAFTSALGWFLSWLHWDLERIFRLAGRTTLKPQQDW